MQPLPGQPVVVVGLGNFVVVFLPTKRDYLLNVAVAMVTIGLPAIILGVLLFLVCWVLCVISRN